MSTFPVDCKTLLNELAEKLTREPSEEAIVSVYNASLLLILAGHGEYSYKALSSLLSGELAISSDSALVNQYKGIFLSLCHGLKMSSPCLPNQKAMSFLELSEFLKTQEKKGFAMLLLDRWGAKYFLPREMADLVPPTPPLPDGWTEGFIERLIGKGEPLDWAKVRDFLYFDGYRSIQAFIRFGDIDSAIKLIEVYRLACNANKRPWQWEVLMIAIKTYVDLGQEEKAREYLTQWWQATEDRERMTIEIVTLIGMPDVASTFLSGVLQDIMDISEADAINFLGALNSRSYTSPTPFIPTVTDWYNFLGTWNEAIFDNLDEEYMDIYKSQYSNVLKQNFGQFFGIAER